MSDWAPDPARFGDKLGPAFVALVDALQTADEIDRVWARDTVVQRSGLNPKTFATLLADLSHFGLVHRGGKPNYRISLTLLGRQWLETPEARAVRARWATGSDG